MYLTGEFMTPIAEFQMFVKKALSLSGLASCREAFFTLITICSSICFKQRYLLHYCCRFLSRVCSECGTVGEPLIFCQCGHFQPVLYVLYILLYPCPCMRATTTTQISRWREVENYLVTNPNLLSSRNPSCNPTTVVLIVL